MILTACDENYLSEAEILIKSCAKYEPNQKFYLFLVNTETSIDDKIYRWHPNIIIEHANPYNGDTRLGVINCVRSIALQQVLEKYNEPTLYLDADTILLKPLTELWNLLHEYDLTVLLRPQLDHIGVAGTPHASKFNSGVIGVKNSDAGKQFIQEYNRLLHTFLKSGKPVVLYKPEYKIKVWADQELLYVAYLNLQDTLNFNPLPTKFNDAKFKPDSIIWHGKGTARKHPRYVREKLRYSNKSLFYLFSVYYALYASLRAIKHSFYRHK